MFSGRKNPEENLDVFFKHDWILQKKNKGIWIGFKAIVRRMKNAGKLLWLNTAIEEILKEVLRREIQGLKVLPVYRS